jgi:hypothetical protein
MNPTIQIINNSIVWKLNDLKHRPMVQNVFRPAVINPDGSVEYWINGVQLDTGELEKMQPKKIDQPHYKLFADETELFLNSAGKLHGKNAVRFLVCDQYVSYQFNNGIFVNQLEEFYMNCDDCDCEIYPEESDACSCACHQNSKPLPFWNAFSII